jgi:hypothetical protein
MFSVTEGINAQTPKQKMGERTKGGSGGRSGWRVWVVGSGDSWPLETALLISLVCYIRHTLKLYDYEM